MIERWQMTDDQRGGCSGAQGIVSDNVLSNLLIVSKPEHRPTSNLFSVDDFLNLINH